MIDEALDIFSRFQLSLTSPDSVGFDLARDMTDFHQSVFLSHFASQISCFKAETGTSPGAPGIEWIAESPGGFFLGGGGHLVGVALISN